VTCSECSNVTSREDEFSEINLNFPPPDENTGVRTRQSTLANLYENYYRMTICVFLATATHQQHDKRVSQCPRILTVVLSHNVYTEEGAVDFPLEQVCPSTLGVQQEEIASNTVYKRFGIVQHTSNSNGGGHYTAITHDDTVNVWHMYDDHDVKVCNFRNRGTNKALVLFQKTARVLF
jgi:hypothetical protein